MPPIPLAADLSLLGWLAAYCLALVPMSVLGGWLLQRLRPSHRTMQHLMSLVAGLMLGIAVLHMLPHAAEVASELSMHGVGYAVLGGMLATFLLLRWFHFHQHESPAVAACTHPHDHDAHPHPPQEIAPTLAEQAGHSHRAQRMHWAGVLAGMSIHSLMDGVALGSAMRSHPGGWPAIGVMLAIAVHKPLDSMTITGLMMAGGWSRRSQTAVNLGYALLCPLGAGLLLIGLSDPYWLGLMLAASAGVFLCIALSDLLPEMEFHSHDRVSLTVALLIGVGVAAGLQWLEPPHGH